MKIIGRNAALTYAGAASRFGITCESATPSEAKQITPTTTKIASDSQSCGQSRPNTRCPVAVMITICSAVLVIALPAIPAR